MMWFLSLALSGAVISTPATPSAPERAIVPATTITAQALIAADSRRVRAATPRMRGLVADGIRRSRTFADLVIQIHATDLIVYVEPTFNLPPDLAGRIMLSAVAGSRRYLRVQVRATLQGDQMIAVVAHEFRHALEVAADPSVVDEASLAALYRRIGDAHHGTSGYDTAAARTTGHVVRDELVG
jgi:hypothetical protein